MKVLVVYDTLYGNTEAIARAISDALTGDVKVAQAGKVDAAMLADVDLLVVGAPTHEGKPMRTVQEFLDRLPDLRGARVTAFDTRMSSRMVGVFGYAANSIAAGLKAKGGVLVGHPEGFLVERRRGPLKQGELERAEVWARTLADAMPPPATRRERAPL